MVLAKTGSKGILQTIWLRCQPSRWPKGEVLAGWTGENVSRLRLVWIAASTAGPCEVKESARFFLIFYRKRPVMDSAVVKAHDEPIIQCVRGSRWALEINSKQRILTRKAMKSTDETLSVRSWMRRSAPMVTCAGLLLVGSAIQSSAQIYNLAAQDTSLQVNLNGGLSDWTIDGGNQLDQQWFYYSVGTGPVNSIDTISPWTTPTTTTGNSPTLTETYANSILSVETLYDLQSQLPGSGRATLGTTVIIDNVSSTAQTFHFYQYSDFDLGGTPGGQSVQFQGTTRPYEVMQTGNGGLLTGTINALSGGTFASVEEVAGVYDGTQFGLANGNPAPIFNDSSLSASGNVDYAYEIDATVAPGSSIVISEIQSVPEPGALALLSAGLLGLGVLGRRRPSLFKKQ